MQIPRAIPLEDDSSGVDTLFGLRKTDEGKINGENFVEAEFSCFSCVSENAERWDLNARGRLRITYEASSSRHLPRRDNTPVLLNTLNVNTFYEALKSIGFEYTGLFRRLSTIERRMNRAKSTAFEYPEDNEMPAMIHPAVLDAAFQSVFAALQYPEDGSMKAPFVPTQIDCIRIATKTRCLTERTLTIESFITENKGSQIVADVELYNAETGELNVQVEGIACTSLDGPRASNDNEIYAQTVWKADVSTSIVKLPVDHAALSTKLELIDLCERLAYMYLRQLNASVSREEIPGFAWNHQRIFEWIDRLFPIIQSGQHATVPEIWSFDDPTWLLEQASRFSGEVDIQLIKAVGNNLLAAVRGETTILEHMTANDMFDRYNEFGLGMRDGKKVLSKTVAQIAHRFPSMKILEIGAGSGSTTKSILQEIDHGFKSYTFTDDCDDFSKAQHALQPWMSKIKFQKLNVEGIIKDQGFEENSYDLVIAANALATSKNLHNSLANIRKLLKPGDICFS